jgi:GAF domain-containing protein
MSIEKKLANLKKQLTSLTVAIGSLEQELQQPSEASARCNDQSKNVLTAIASYLALSPGMEDNALLTMTLRCAMHVVRAGGAGLTLFDQDKQRLVFKAAIGEGSKGMIGYEVPLQGSQHGLAFATGEVQSATPIHSGAEDAAKAVFRNVLVAPLIVDGEVIGTMSAVNKQDGDHFSPADMEAYQLFADMAATIVRQNLRGQIFERFILGEDKVAPAGLEGLQVSEEDQQLLDSIQHLVSIAHNRSEMLPICCQIIAQMARG